MNSRAVSFNLIFNFRDLGGYRTVEGHSVRWRRLFRADDLSRLVPVDHPRFEALNIRTVIDLRRPDEVATSGRVPAMNGFAYHHVHLRYPEWQHVDFADLDERVGYLRERYREIIDSAGEGIGAALRLIAEADASPLVFHCVAGKDRTGIVAALVLALLGVDDAVIADDYSLSELAEDAHWGWRVAAEPDLARLRSPITVSPGEGMLAFLGDLRARFGDIEHYAEAIGVTEAHIAAMRAHLLTPTAPAGS